jgi:hypothetical protein
MSGNFVLIFAFSNPNAMSPERGAVSLGPNTLP